jgi:uncharacterized membrane protein
MDVLLAGATWLHLLATVVLIGQYVLLALIYYPLLRSRIKAAELGGVMEDLGARMRGWIGLSVLIFILTGIYLTLRDPAYLGVGNFGNAWSILMLIKHILVLAFIGVGKVAESKGSTDSVTRLETAFAVLAILGVAILLLTALAGAV